MMKKLLTTTLLALALGAPTLQAANAPAAAAEAQAKEFRDFTYKRFPDIKPADYIYGVYALDADSRAQFDSLNEFPPFEDALKAGEVFYNQPLKNGKSLKDCLGNPKGLRAMYPFFDTKTGQVRNLEADIIQCAAVYGEEKFEPRGKDLRNTSAYLAFMSRGEKVNVIIPDDPRALASFEAGRAHFYRKTGQLNLSCADCHSSHAGQRIRSETLSPAIGKTAHFPVWRFKDDQGLVTLNMRFSGCVRDTRAATYRMYGEEFRNLEYFLAYIDNGLVITGPAVRK